MQAESVTIIGTYNSNVVVLIVELVELELIVLVIGIWVVVLIVELVELELIVLVIGIWVVFVCVAVVMLTTGTEALELIDCICVS